MIRIIVFTFLSILITSCVSTDNKEISVTKEEYDVFIDRTFEIVPNAFRMNLTMEYTKRHYGKPILRIDVPKIIVVHSTETKTLNEALNIFNRDLLFGREDISKGGDINVGIHFIVDRDGTIYSSTPMPYIARHVIGLNYTAIGIENVGNFNNLTDKQLEANVKLIKYLQDMYKTIKYVIGHYEYTDTSKPHFYLFMELDKSYTITIKKDPGEYFMYFLREKLK